MNIGDLYRIRHKAQDSKPIYVSIVTTPFKGVFHYINVFTKEVDNVHIRRVDILDYYNNMDELNSSIKYEESLINSILPYDDDDQFIKRISLVKQSRALEQSWFQTCFDKLQAVRNYLTDTIPMLDEMAAQLNEIAKKNQEIMERSKTNNR